MTMVRMTYFATLLLVVVCGESSKRAYGNLQDQTYDVMPYAAKYVMPEEEVVEEDPYELNERKKPRSPASRTVERVRKEDLTKAIASLASGQLTEADTFAKEFLFPQMTQPAQLSELGNLRNLFLNRFLNASSGASRRQFIEQTCLPILKKIAEGNYHPAARLNAVLLIGGLNDVDANTSERKAPVPNAQAVDYLLSLAESPDTPEFLRVGAMTGLHRLATFQAAENRTDAGPSARIFRIALAIMQNAFPGQDRWSSEVNYWLKRRSAQILGLLKNKGPNNEAVVALQETLKKEDLEPLLRQDVMIALREMKVEGDAARATLDSVISLAAKVLEDEAKSIRSLIEEYVSISLLLDDSYLIDGAAFQKSSVGRDKPAAGAGGLEGGNEGPAQSQKQSGKKEGFDLPNYAINTIRRRLKSSLYHLHKTLSSEALQQGLSAEDKQRVNKARRIIEVAIRDTDIGLVDLSKPDATTPYDAQLKEKTTSELMYDRFMGLSSDLKALKK